MTGAFLGTSAYAAPEQIRGDVRAVDVRTDLYALGAILYRLLTGVPPLEDRGDLAALVQEVLHADPVRPSARNPALNRELDAILLKSLAKRPDNRYASVAAFADDLRRFLTGQAVLAHPPSTIYQVGKFVRKHRLAVGSTAFFLLVLLSTTIAVSSLWLSRLLNKREEARGFPRF